MKVRIDLPEEDLAFIDEYASRRGMTSRSSVLQRAISLLREADLENAYATASDEWSSSVETSLWDKTASDGIADAVSTRSKFWLLLGKAALQLPQKLRPNR